MKTYRNRNGTYCSRNKHLARETRRLKVYCMALVLMATVGVISHYRTTEVVIHHAEASATTTKMDVCGLMEVICENEEPVMQAIGAVETALGHGVTDETKKRINYLYEKATQAGVPFDDAVKTVYCESQWQSVQSGVVKNGVQEPSYGLAQIHLPSHKGVTKEQAMDAYYAIDFMVSNWDTAWYGYDRQTGMCTNGLKINL